MMRLVLLRTQSDERLVRLAREGSEPAFALIVERHRRAVMGACRRILPDSRAEDAAQQVYLAAWKALRRGDEVRDVRPWLLQIARNTALNALRVRGYDYDELREGLRVGEAPEEELDRRDVIRQTLAGLAALPERQREVLLRSAVEGAPHADIARDLGLSEGATRQLMLRARTTLRAAASALTPWPLVLWAAQAGGGAAAAGGATAAAAKLGTAAVLVGGVAVGGPAIVRDAPVEPEPAAAADARPVKPQRRPAAAAPAAGDAAAVAPAPVTPASRARSVVEEEKAPPRSERRRSGRSRRVAARERDDSSGRSQAPAEDGDDHRGGDDGDRVEHSGPDSHDEDAVAEAEAPEGGADDSGSGSSSSGPSDPPVPFEEDDSESGPSESDSSESASSESESSDESESLDDGA